MALQTEVWIQDIKEVLYKENPFLGFSEDHSSYIANKTVHIPQSGSGPGIVVNRTTLPATIAQRTDTEKTYDMDEYTTDPILIRNLDELQISYNKRMSVTGQHLKTLTERIGDVAAYNWSNVSNLVRTTGAASSTALAPSATGTRLSITVQDVANLALALDMQLVPQEGRYLMLPSALYWQLYTISDIVRASSVAYSQTNLATGVVAELLGFKIVRRPTVSAWTTGATIKAVGAAGATTDHLGAIAWHPSFVSKAQGSIDIYSDFGDNGKGKPEYYGGILSACVMFGSATLRSDAKGIVNLVQG